jgi:hypothetical protein
MQRGKQILFVFRRLPAACQSDGALPVGIVEASVGPQIASATLLHPTTSTACRSCSRPTHLRARLRREAQGSNPVYGNGNGSGSNEEGAGNLGGGGSSGNDEPGGNGNGGGSSGNDEVGGNGNGGGSSGNGTSADRKG